MLKDLVLLHKRQRSEIITGAQPVSYYINCTKYNKSECVFTIRLKNIGNLQLENIKLYLTFNDEYYTSERVLKQNRFLDNYKYESNIKWNRGSNDLVFTSHNELLVPNDEILSDKICLRPNIEYPFCTIIPWKLVSKEYTEFGVLKLKINTKYIEIQSTETYSTHFEYETILQNYSSNKE